MIKKLTFFLGIISTLVLVLPGPACKDSKPSVSPPVYDFEIVRDWMTMPDGIKLSVTYFMPVSKRSEEKFPVLLEMLPYRKDDVFYQRDYPLFTYFVRRGYVVAKVDIRGTGTSEGKVPPREYSESELNDAVEIIGQLATAPWSNGNIGMWGISWGGFNAIQVAMRRPPGLKAIMASCATDDLYHDDVHFIDGIYHVDQYELRIDTRLALPRWPDYKLDTAYFEDRFEAYPWFLTYLKNQRDGEFWRKNSLRWDYEAIQIPVYLLGGLLDGYRDSIPRMLENMKVPIRAELGPYNHAWPDNAVPGPNYEWRHELIRWWDHWLKGLDTGIMDDPRFALFAREGHPPDTQLKTIPGQWRYEDWPLQRTQWTDFFPAAELGLTSSPENPGVDKLEYLPDAGIEAGYWWGELTPDMGETDAGCLVYDSKPLKEPIEILGFPQVHLKVSVDVKLAHWIVRLEDVHPDGRVSQVTGAALNGSQRKSRVAPEYLVPGEVYELAVPLHFTTWTFSAGHRIRLAVSNALFPMLWPTPYPMTSQLYIGERATRLVLPVIPPEDRPVPAFLPPQPRETRPDARSLPSPGWPYKHLVSRDPESGITQVEWEGENRWEIEDHKYIMIDKTLYRTNTNDPADSSFQGESIRVIQMPERMLELKTLIQVRSDLENFYVNFTRQIFENDQMVRERTWEETIPREFN